MSAGPFVALAALVGGIFAGERAGPGASVGMLAVGAVGVVGAWVVDGRARVAVAAIALALLGAAAMQRALDGQVHSRFSLAAATRATATIGGVVVDDPSAAPFTTAVLVRATATRGAAPRIVVAEASGDDAARLRALEAGDHVVLSGRMEPLRPGFDQQFRWRHAVARLDAAQVESLRPPTGLLAVANGLRGVVLRGTASMAPTPRAVTAGFLLGDTRGIPTAVVAAYRGAGLSHLLAVSGENVAFVLALVAPLCRRLPLGARTTVALATILVFAAMTRFEPSVLRASVMAALVVFATFLGRPASTLRVLALAVIVLLLCDPFLVHSVAFVLSAGASAGIALLARPIADRLPGPGWIREPLSVSLAAQVGVAPVLLAVFGTVPLVAPLTNLCAAPAAQTLGVYGMVASIASGVVPGLGPVAQVPSALLAGWVDAVARAGAAVPVQVDARGACAGVALAAAGAACWVAFGRARRPVPDAASR